MHPFLLVQATANRTCGSRRSGGAKSIAGYGDPKTRERRRSATTVDVEPPRARVPVADESRPESWLGGMVVAWWGCSAAWRRRDAYPHVRLGDSDTSPRRHLFFFHFPPHGCATRFSLTRGAEPLRPHLAAVQVERVASGPAAVQTMTRVRAVLAAGQGASPTPIVRRTRHGGRWVRTLSPGLRECPSRLASQLLTTDGVSPGWRVTLHV
jgi:hypothetical protein